MLNRLRHRFGYLILLVLIVPGLVMTSAGEARAHGVGAPAGVQAVYQETAGHGHGHVHTHRHEQEDGRHLNHEHGGHFHETADRLATGMILDPVFRDALRVDDKDGGHPLHRVYRLERPPRPVIAC